MPTFRNTLSVPSSMASRSYLLAYENGTVCSETLAFKLQTSGNTQKNSHDLLNTAKFEIKNHSRWLVIHPTFELVVSKLRRLRIWRPGNLDSILGRSKRLFSSSVPPDLLSHPWVTWALSSGVKQLRCEAVHSCQSTFFKKDWSCTSIFPTSALLWSVEGLNTFYLYRLSVSQKRCYCSKRCGAHVKII
jgi:hypothetical protein